MIAKEKSKIDRKIWYMIYVVFNSSLFETFHRDLPIAVNDDIISMELFFFRLIFFAIVDRATISSFYMMLHAETY